MGAAAKATAAATVRALVAAAVCLRAGAETIPTGDCAAWEAADGWTTLKGCCGDRLGVALKPFGSGGGFYDDKNLDLRTRFGITIGDSMTKNKADCQAWCAASPNCTAAFMDHDGSLSFGGSNEWCYRYELDTTGWVGNATAGNPNKVYHQGCTNKDDTCFVKKGCRSMWNTTTPQTPPSPTPLPATPPAPSPKPTAAATTKPTAACPWRRAHPPVHLR